MVDLRRGMVNLTNDQRRGGLVERLGHLGTQCVDRSKVLSELVERMERRVNEGISLLSRRALRALELDLNLLAAVIRMVQRCVHPR